VHRTPLLSALDAYARRHPEEAATTERFRAFVAAHDNCFSRQLEIGHVTGSAWVVDGDGVNALLTHHRKLDIWVQLGGHADDDPDTLAVALREAEEESGLDALIPAVPEIFDIDIHTIPARGSEPEHEHFDVRYALCATGSTAFRVSAESKALAWVPVTQLDALTREPSMLRMQRKWRVLADVLADARRTRNSMCHAGKGVGTGL